MKQVECETGWVGITCVQKLQSSSVKIGITENFGRKDCKHENKIKFLGAVNGIWWRAPHGGGRNTEFWGKGWGYFEMATWHTVVVLEQLHMEGTKS